MENINYNESNKSWIGRQLQGAAKVHEWSNDMQQPKKISMYNDMTYYRINS